MYNHTCPDCGGHIEKLSISETENNELHKSFNKAARWIYREKKNEINADDIDNSASEPFLNAVNNVLKDGLNSGIEHTVPYAMRRTLSEDVYIFSGAKTYTELKELSRLLLDDNQNIKPFNKFWQDVQAIYPMYNENYLQAEYIFATQSAQMASKWVEYEADGDRYNLQYRTAFDDRVRETHMALHNTTLPPSDPFWNDYYPPNGWRCRCTTVQVRKSKYPESNSVESRLAGAEATAGKNTIFRFNPGKQKVIFPEHHPYLKNLSDDEHSKLKIKAKNDNEVKTAEDVVRVVNDVSKGKGWFERGFKKLEATRRSDLNGATDMSGNIWLTKDRMDKTISAVNKLTKSEKITFDEADSVATFWHEVTHNRNKKGLTRLTATQRDYMELANEFVARNTLSDFYGAFGSKLQHSEFVTNRISTGYNMRVNNYQKIIGNTGLDREKVAEKVKKHLFDEPYRDQKTGLINALEGAVKKDKKKLTKKEITKLVTSCNTFEFDGVMKEIVDGVSQ